MNDLNPILSKNARLVAAIKSIRFALLHYNSICEIVVIRYSMWFPHEMYFCSSSSPVPHDVTAVENAGSEMSIQSSSITFR